MSNQPLSSYQKSSPRVTLYNEECMLCIEPEKVDGFLVLLNNDSTLAFMALTDGNLIDACLGAPPQSREGARYEMSREAKNALAASSDTSDAIQALAVETYKKSLGIVKDHHMKIKKVIVCCRCFVQRGIKRKAKAEIQEAFRMLQEAVAASSG